MAAKAKRAPQPSAPKGTGQVGVNKTVGRVIPDLSLWLQFQRIGGALSPQQVSAIIREADTGFMHRLMDLANDARQKDCHLQSVLATSEEAIAGLDWRLELPKNAKRKERKASEKIEQILRDSGHMPKLFAHHAGARFYSYAVTETSWKRDGDMLVPESFEHHAPRRFGYRIDTGRFVWRDINAGMPLEGVDLADYPSRFIQSHPRVNGDVPVREGLVRVLMWAALFRNWTLADWLKLGEIAWKPWRKGKYKKGSDQEDIDNLTAILEGMASSGVCTHSEDTEIEVDWPANSGQSQHGALFDKMGAEMSKAVLGQTLTTEQGKVGSQALGNVQNEVRKDLREATARYVAADVTRDLIAPMTSMNFGPGIRPARLVFLTDDAMDLVALSTAVEKLASPNVGLRIPSKWVRDKAGIPEPTDAEECIGGATETEPAETPQDTAKEPQGEAAADPNEAAKEAA